MDARDKFNKPYLEERKIEYNTSRYMYTVFAGVKAVEVLKEIKE